ncbi:AgrD family cyclic lactone autoinducer peptide [Desulforamulus aeronauticus]|nr:cyclic lactone autoinducer peptide [Desulforamulus aeronauticus]
MHLLKKLIYSPIVLSALFVAAIGIKPASFYTWYQPAPPTKK